MREVDWLIGGEPREAQLEALRRSYYGYALRDHMDDPGRYRVLPGRTGSPALGWGHFLEMRVGKTPTFLNEGALFRRDYDLKWQIVMAPNAFKEDWGLEAEKFGYPAPAFVLTSGNLKAAQRFVDKNKARGGLFAVNYEALRSKAVLAFLEQLMGERVLTGADESITIKGHDSAITKGAIDIAKMSFAKRLLTGKPVTQGPHDLWAQLRFIAEINGFNYHAFKTAFCAMGGFKGKQILGVREDNAERLQTILTGCSWNARKVDWLKTPGKDYAERRLSLLPDQLATYEQMQDEFLAELADGTLVVADQIITKLIKMQQIASGFIIDEDKVAHNLMPPDKNPKVLEVRRMMEEEIENKIIIVCHYTHSLNILEEALAQYQPAVIRGDDWHRKAGRDKISEKARFNGDRGCRVMLGQEQALRYGHTLMGNEQDPCLTELFYENNYSLNDRSQCEERPQGSGQMGEIAIFDFIATEKDRETIHSLQRKEDVAAQILQYARNTGILPRKDEDDGEG